MKFLEWKKQSYQRMKLEDLTNEFYDERIKEIDEKIEELKEKKVYLKPQTQ